MLIQTKHFGEIDFDESKIVTMEKGIFGFEGNQRWAILYDNSDKQNIICWLQSIEDAGLCLPLIKPDVFFYDYNPDVPDEVLKQLGSLQDQAYDLYNVVVIPEDLTKMTVNLKAPIIIHLDTKKGIQVVLDSDKYPIRYNLYDLLTEKEGE